MTPCGDLNWNSSPETNPPGVDGGSGGAEAAEAAPVAALLLPLRRVDMAEVCRTCPGGGRGKNQGKMSDFAAFVFCCFFFF